MQCSECLLYWNQDIVLLHLWAPLGERINPADVSADGNWIFSQSRTVSLRRGGPHGARHGETEAHKEHFIAHDARKKCIKKNFKGIHDRFQKDLRYRDSQLKVGRDRGEVHRDGRVGTERFHLSPIN